MRRIHIVSVRLTYEERQFVSDAANYMQLPNEDQPNLSRVIQSMVGYLRNTVGHGWIRPQERKPCTRVTAPARRVA